MDSKVIDQHDFSGDRKVHFCDDKMNCTKIPRMSVYRHGHGLMF